MKNLTVLYKKEKGALKPTQGYENDFAYDIYAAEGRLVPPLTFRSVIVPTNLKLAFDPLVAGMQISLRSGAAAKTPLIVSNSPGIVEGTYRGGVGILVRNSFIDSHLVDFVMTVEGKRLPVSKVPAKVLKAAKKFYDEETELLGYDKVSEDLQKSLYKSVVPRGTVYIAKHDRIAQVSFAEKIVADFKEAEVLPESVRQENKFGSSGSSISLVDDLVEPNPLDEGVKANKEILMKAIENSQKIKKRG